MKVAKVQFLLKIDGFCFSITYYLLKNYVSSHLQPALPSKTDRHVALASRRSPAVGKPLASHQSSHLPYENFNFAVVDVLVHL